MNSWNEITRAVEERASGRCEYCRMHQSLHGASFHVEHILPRSQGGPSELDNLAWACPSCNLHKSSRTSVIVPETGDPVPLYHPRRDRWEGHFSWQGFRIVGLTPVGRATIDALALNSDRRLKIRQAEALFHLFPTVTEP